MFIGLFQRLSIDHSGNKSKAGGVTRIEAGSKPLKRPKIKVLPETNIPMTRSRLSRRRFGRRSLAALASLSIVPSHVIRSIRKT